MKIGQAMIEQVVEAYQQSCKMLDTIRRQLLPILLQIFSLGRYSLRCGVSPCSCSRNACEDCRMWDRMLWGAAWCRFRMLVPFCKLLLYGRSSDT